MKVLFCTSEALPFAASGGLGDVAGSLPQALRQRLIGCRIVMPMYEDIPQELHTYWKDQYTEIDFISAKIGQIEECGYAPFGYFVLPESAWLESFYAPLEAKRAAFLEKHGQNEKARLVVEEFDKEVAMYREFKKYYGYVFYIARKV